jgi:predicted TIM-barrel fold metal-dependent hydrolase
MSVAADRSAETPLLDRTLDVDGHEFAPPHLWGAVFGPTAAKLAPVCEPFAAMMGEDYMVLPHLIGDHMPMTLENVWRVRTTGAPGAFDMRRRLEAMDLMGVRRQLIFPSFGLFAQILATGPDGGGAIAQAMQNLLGGGLSPQEAQRLGWAAIDEYNDWAVRTSALDPDRLRPVGILKHARDVDDLIAQAKGLIDRGLRGVLINTGSPPAGISPAAHALDPFWALLAERDVPILAHVGGDLGFLGSSQWSAAEAFTPTKMGLEVGLDPYSYATVHLCVVHWLTVMVMGGVFERHPRLRFGAMELGGHWLGPLADNLDMWATTIFARRMKPIISMRPSEHLARNVRVTPYNIIEPIDELMTRYPQLASCYCYSTDYPHLEGGTDIKAKVYGTLKPLGEEILEKYFVRNGEWLLPD